MLQVNIGEAKANLSKLVERASKGEEFIIAKAGRPMVKVVPIIQQTKPERLGGLLKGDTAMPDDFDSMCSDEIVALFESQESTCV